MVPLSKNCWLGFFYMWCMSAKWQQLSFVYSWKFPTRQRCIGYILLGDVILISTFYKQPKHWTLVPSLSIYRIIISSFLDKNLTSIFTTALKKNSALYIYRFMVLLFVEYFPSKKWICDCIGKAFHRATEKRQNQTCRFYPQCLPSCCDMSVLLYTSYYPFVAKLFECFVCKVDNSPVIDL